MTRLDSQRWQGRTRTACLVYLQAAAGQRAPGSARLIMSGKGISHQPITGLLPRPPARPAADDGYSASMSAAITSHAIVHRLKLPLSSAGWSPVQLPTASAADRVTPRPRLPTRSHEIHSTILTALDCTILQVGTICGHPPPRALPAHQGRAAGRAYPDERSGAA